MAINIKSKTGRVALATRPEPYWERISAGCHLGFRAGAGTWVAKHRDAATGVRLTHALGEFADFDQAATAARAWFEQVNQGVATDATVQGACDAYVAKLDAAGRKAAAKDAKGRFKRLVNDKRFGSIKLAGLRKAHVEAWRDAQIKDAGEGEALRKAKDSANRNLATLKAALNAAHAADLTTSDRAWKLVDKYAQVGQRRRDAFLSVEQRQALIAVCPADLAALVKAALLTGFRPGELAKLTASDVASGTGTVRVPGGKTGHRDAAVSSAALAFLKAQAKDKLPLAPLLTRTDGKAWDKDAWKKLFDAARAEAKLPPAVVLYSCRHTAISEMIMGGMDSLAVAKLTGTSVAMIESNYGHLTSTHLQQQLDRVSIL